LFFFLIIPLTFALSYCIQVGEKKFWNRIVFKKNI
jgi:hypothetical protein